MWMPVVGGGLLATRRQDKKRVDGVRNEVEHAHKRPF